MTTFERGRRLQVVLEGMGRLGEAMVEVDGKPVFVFGGIPGEEVELEVIREHRHYVAAKVVKVDSASSFRIEPECKYFGLCTGCQWQHIGYQHQLELKRLAVEDALRRVGGILEAQVLPTLPSPNQLGYRNHARFTVGRREGVLGFVNRETRRFIEIDECLLMAPWINEALGKLKGHCSETSQVAIRYGSQSGDWLIQPTLSDPGVPFPTGQKNYLEMVRGVDFKVSSPAFFQVNIPQLERMVDLLRDALSLSGDETLVDAYAGVGTFASLLAPFAGKVIAIEESAAAISDAYENIALRDNVSIMKGKTENVLTDLQEMVDCIVLDPPRSGCQLEALSAVAKLAPRKVAYVSCDPQTLARDLKILTQGPYQIESVQPLDMFPQTHHVECLATLRLKTGHPITLASSSPRRIDILNDAGIPFNVIWPEGDEDLPGGRPEDHVQILALNKATQVAATLNRGLVIAGDTVVVDGSTVLGKPADQEAALSMLAGLRGKLHHVITGVAVVDAATMESTTGVKTSWVRMRNYTDKEARTFVESGEALDKAGAYAVQDELFHPAEYVEGCYFNVVGLPLCLTVDLLRQMGADVSEVTLPQGCTVVESRGQS